MGDFLFYTPDGSPALEYAKQFLSDKGVPFSPIPSGAVTHLLVGVPAKNVPWESLLSAVSPCITILGGNLTDIPVLKNYGKYDLLQDPFYVAENADITARCALHLAAGKLPVTFKDLPVLVVGWGRIGKCLSKHLKALGASVTVAARNPKDQAMLRALGYGITTIQEDMSNIQVLFNTADSCGIRGLPDTCLKIDLATKRGIEDADTLEARGLPGKLAPESSGRLIAETVLRLIS